MKWWHIVLAVVASLGIAGYIAFQNYWYYLPGIIGAIRDPVGPNQPVAWEQGPATPAPLAPGEARPPNIILILADDLGFNDLTFGGGGVANRAVPTPNIDS